MVLTYITKRKQLLYDCQAEQSSIVRAQVALLLSHSYYSQPPLCDLATMWLSRAIRHAELSGAQHYDAPCLGRQSTDPEENKHRNTLKRLWWCCIIRDRILSLTSHRGIQITRDSFDFNAKSYLGLADLYEEIDHSKIYDKAAKMTLIELLQAFVEFCVLLTDVLEEKISNHVDDYAILASIEQYEHLIHDYKRRLKVIRNSTSVSRCIVSSGTTQSSIALFANLSIMYTWFVSRPLVS